MYSIRCLMLYLIWYVIGLNFDELIDHDQNLMNWIVYRFLWNSFGLEIMYTIYQQFINSVKIFARIKIVVISDVRYIDFISISRYFCSYRIVSKSILHLLTYVR